MFPAPIARQSVGAQAAYLAAVLVTLAVWMLPLVAVALTSLRSLEDLQHGNLWGWPRDLRPLANYATVLTMSRMPQFVVNSFLVAIPAVLGTLLLSSMAGFALAKHDFRGSLPLLMLPATAPFVGSSLMMYAWPSFSADPTLPRSGAT